MTETELQIRHRFNKYIDNINPLKDLFDELDEENGIMLQAYFEDFAKEILEQRSEVVPHDTAVKWLTLASADGERAIKQHAFKRRKKVKYYNGKDEGNISLCGKIIATKWGPEDLTLDEIEAEELDKENACRICLSKSN